MDGKVPVVFDEKDGVPIFIDQRELVLSYRIPVSRIEMFFEGLKKGELLGTKCATCNEIYFPPQADCPKCSSSKLEWVKLSNDGELLSYTIIYVKPRSFGEEDYAVGVVRLPEGVNVLARIWESRKEVLKVGKKMKLKIAPDRKGTLVYGFEPVGD